MGPDGVAGALPLGLQAGGTMRLRGRFSSWVVQQHNSTVRGCAQHFACKVSKTGGCTHSMRMPLMHSAGNGAILTM